jgi:NIMA (never in mitosis gene a)-related kinase 2
MHSHDFASTYVGTPFYMSPEICAAERYTLYSDIWALGCIIYELCAKEPPFNAKTHFHLVEKIKSGRYPSLPHFYSPELQGVIAKCLQVNPTKRPDTAQLLNMPVVKLMRKEREVVELGRALKSKEELAAQKLREWEGKMTDFEIGKERLRHEIEETVRRELETQARLEIDRQVQLEVERLRKNFEVELLDKVEAEVERRMHSFSMTKQQPPSDRISDIPTSSVSTSSDTDFPSQTDLTGLSIGGLSIESPVSQHTQPQKRGSRTPFNRSQTICVGSPMDVQMAEPSPMSIASLSLSPRRTNSRFGTGRNIFAAAAEQKWAPSHLIPSDDEDEDENQSPPSPTVQKPSMGKVFKSPTRPNLLAQKALPLIPRPQSQHSLFSLPKGPMPSFPSHAELRAPSQATASETTLIDKKHTSPNRRLSRIPSSANLNAVNDSGSPVRRCSKKAAVNPITANSDDIHKVVTKNNMLKGRTLVELAQARAGGRPISVVENSGDNGAELATVRSNIMMKRQTMAGGEIKLAAKIAERDVAMWDPERDEMPSPFLARGVRGVRKGLR